MELLDAHAPEFIPVVRELFVEYARAIGVDLCFQSFERELAELPGAYAPPSGGLWLGRTEEDWAGCVGLREIEPGVGEMKRLYVRPAFRGRGLGRELAEHSIATARLRGWRSVRLDTLSTMTGALSLYDSLGFQKIPAYYTNPLEPVVYLELKLA